MTDLQKQIYNDLKDRYGKATLSKAEMAKELGISISTHLMSDNSIGFEISSFIYKVLSLLLSLGRGLTLRISSFGLCLHGSLSS